MPESSDCGQAFGTQKGPVDPYPLNCAQIHRKRFTWFPSASRPQNRPHTPSSGSAGGGVIFCRQSSRRPQGEFSWEMRAFQQRGGIARAARTQLDFTACPTVEALRRTAFRCWSVIPDQAKTRALNSGNRQRLSAIIPLSSAPLCSAFAAQPPFKPPAPSISPTFSGLPGSESQSLSAHSLTKLVQLLEGIERIL